jgi:hypothetical protein
MQEIGREMVREPTAIAAAQVETADELSFPRERQ